MSEFWICWAVDRGLNLLIVKQYRRRTNLEVQEVLQVQGGRKATTVAPSPKRPYWIDIPKALCQILIPNCSLKLQCWCISKYNVVLNAARWTNVWNTRHINFSSNQIWKSSKCSISFVGHKIDFNKTWRTSEHSECHAFK